MTLHKRQMLTLALVFFWTIPAWGGVPVIYCTDLFHPHEDPDDHFDLATLFALPELEIQAIILDQGNKQRLRPGSIPVSQMNHITGRQIPVVVGLPDKLEHPADKAFNQPAEFQDGVALILKTLRQSPRPVSVATVGSVRDVVVAVNREPALCRNKIERLLVFIGEASDSTFREYNVSLDVEAYLGLMRSGLTVWWVPCFDGGAGKNRGHASFWRASHRDLLQNVAPEVMQYFIYALQKPDAEPIPFLSSPVNADQREQLLKGVRNLWCTAIFEVLAWPPDKIHGEVFGFSPVDVVIDDEGVIHYRSEEDSHTVMRFEVLNPVEYVEVMTQETARLLAHLGSGQRGAAK